MISVVNGKHMFSEVFGGFNQLLLLCHHKTRKKRGNHNHREDLVNF